MKLRAEPRGGGVGTIEFIADASDGLRADRIWFMEMNTRLQVEHPVTEEITGGDLVEWQFRVASGEPLPKTQQQLGVKGWAMEARLYAEDPAAGFLPSIRRLELLRFGETEGGRIDTGVYQGVEVSPLYDPMIAKVIAHGATRDEARQRLRTMLSGGAVWPVKTNASFLVRVLDHPAFAAGNMDTGLIGRDGEALAQAPQPSGDLLARAAQALVKDTLVPGFRLDADPERTASFLLDGRRTEVALDGIGSAHPATSTLVTAQGPAWLLTPWRKDGGVAGGAGDGSILAPMPGRVTLVEVAPGEVVTKRQKLLTLEAMKMGHTLTAPFDGTVVEVNATAGTQVQVDALLTRIEVGEV